MSTTIRDVARTAGVGLGTVSRVLNNSPLVSAETRERVQTVIQKLNYVPSPNARRLSLGKTLSVAVVVPFFTRPAEVERLRGIEHTLVDTEYDLILYNVETPEQRDAAGCLFLALAVWLFVCSDRRRDAPAVLLGVPMYSNAAGIIPIVQALLEKGAALGTVLAFMMAVIGLSLPETIILRRVLKPTLIAVFVGVVGTGIVLVGYLFNGLF